MRRSVLFVPANNQKMMEKARTLSADMVILDCEDSVPQREKVKAREMASSALRDSDWVKKEVGIRVNGLETSQWREDVDAAVTAKADFIVIPKVESANDVLMVADEIGRTNQHSEGILGLPKLVVTIESPQGLISLREILSSSKTITAIEFGAEDYALSLGIYQNYRKESTTLYARSHVVVLAHAFGVDPLDQAYVRLSDLEGLRKSAMEAKSLGFVGKAVIHPSQIEVVNDVFSPTTADLEWARKVIKGWKIAQEEGRGAFRLEDSMVDVVHVKMAERLLRSASGEETTVGEEKP
jgi:citrate lyase subunit beta/citryl-CoA lyase